MDIAVVYDRMTGRYLIRRYILLIPMYYSEISIFGWTAVRSVAVEYDELHEAVARVQRILRRSGVLKEPRYAVVWEPEID